MYSANAPSFTPCLTLPPKSCHHFTTSLLLHNYLRQIPFPNVGQLGSGAHSRSCLGPSSAHLYVSEVVKGVPRAYRLHTKPFFDGQGEWTIRFGSGALFRPIGRYAASAAADTINDGEATVIRLFLYDLR